VLFGAEFLNNEIGNYSVGAMQRGITPKEKHL
jgi:hypothetical protein